METQLTRNQAQRTRLLRELLTLRLTVLMVGERDIMRDFLRKGEVMERDGDGGGTI